MKKQDVSNDLPFPWEIFEQGLAEHPGGPWEVAPVGSGLADQSIQLSCLDSQQPWCQFDTFWTFFDNFCHRQLLRCLIGRNNRECDRAWSLELLQQETRLSPDELVNALFFCQKQALALPDLFVSNSQRFYSPVSKRRVGWQGRTTPMRLTPEAEMLLEDLKEKSIAWYRGPNLEHISNIGPTLEWVVQEMFEHHFQAGSRRNVTLSRFTGMGDIDVLAFLPDHRSILVECKSSNHITTQQVQHFLAKARDFRPDLAVLLIDMNDHEQLLAREPQLIVARRSVFPHASFKEIRVFGPASPSAICLLPGIFIALSGPRLSRTFSFLLDQERE